MTATPLCSPAEDLELLRSAAVSAGLIAAAYFRRDVKTWNKANASPVTEADIIVDRHLHEMLLGARPGYGWLSEETADDGSRLERARAFIVDPIDGTRGFISGEDSWTVSLAVVEHGVPIAGVVYAPARDELYDARRGGGARRNGVAIERAPSARPPVIPAAGAVHRALAAKGLEHVRGAYLPSLAYRLVQAATGRFDAVAVRRGACDWDVAGATAILSEAGIGFEDVCAGPLRFDRAEIRHGALAATADESLKPVVRAALIEVYGCPGDKPPATDGTTT
jgi:myo-inositol-1(or 4)-monophosphatase